MKEYDPNIYFSILDERGFLGALSARYDDICDFYCGDLHEEAMLFVKKVLYQYNREIAKQKSILPRPIYALRILERRGINPSKGVIVPGKTEATKEALSAFDDEYELGQPCIGSQMITLDHEEANKWANDIPTAVIVNLKENTVHLHNFTRWFDVVEYCIQFGKKKEEFWKVLDSAAYIPPVSSEFSLSKFNFNYMDEVERLVKENKDGIRHDVSDCVIRFK